MNMSAMKSMRPKRSVVRDEFIIMPEGAQCKHCDRFVRCVQSSNMKKHLRYCQPEIFKTVQEADGSFNTYSYHIKPDNNNKRTILEFPKNSIQDFISSQLAEHHATSKDDEIFESSVTPSPLRLEFQKFLDNTNGGGGGDNMVGGDEDASMDALDENISSIFSNFDTVEITNGEKSSEYLLQQLNPFLISKYFDVSIPSLRLRSNNGIVSKVSSNWKSFEPSLIAGKRYTIITVDEANGKIACCKIILDNESYEIPCKSFDKNEILNLIKPAETFVLITENGKILDVFKNPFELKLEERRTYHVIYEKQTAMMESEIQEENLIPIEFPAGIPINRSMSLLAPYMVCISRAMHILTFVGEKVDLKPLPSQILLGKTVGNIAAQILFRMNDALRKIQFVNSNISSSNLNSQMLPNDFNAVFENIKKENGNSQMHFPVTDIDQVIDSLEVALKDIEEFLNLVKAKFKYEISTVPNIEKGVKIEDGCRLRKERVKKFIEFYENEEAEKFESIVTHGLQICPNKNLLDLLKVSESRKHFAFVDKLIDNILQSLRTGKFSFNDLVDLLNFSTDSLHFVYLHWKCFQKFAHFCNGSESHELSKSTMNQLSQQFLNCAKFWNIVSQNNHLFVHTNSTNHIYKLWKSYYDDIIEAQYAVEVMFFSNNF